MNLDSVIIIVLLIMLYILLPFWIIQSDKKKDEQLKNIPPELWRITQWHLLDKQKVYGFLKSHLKELKRLEFKKD